MVSLENAQPLLVLTPHHSNWLKVQPPQLGSCRNRQEEALTPRGPFTLSWFSSSVIVLVSRALLGKSQL